MFSKRGKLELIVQFIEELPSPIKSYESYLEQIASFLPVFERPYEYTGLNPKELERFKEILAKAYQGISSTHIEKSITSLLVAIQTIFNWVGEREQSPDISNAISLFEQKVELVKGIHTVLVPVLEEVGNKFSGRLRNLRVSVAGQSHTGYHDLIPIFSIIGVEKGDELITQNSTKAVNKLTEKLGLTSKKYWQATASFEQKKAWHAGNSANLAMGGLFFCSLLEAMEQREQFRLNPAVVITGDLSKSGEVLPVEESSLKAKVEAAFFSWSHVLVAPTNQLGEVYAQLEKLKVEFPKRELIVIGATHLKDLFYDRRLTIHSKKSQLKHITEKVWKKRFSVASIIVFLGLIGAIASLVIGPIDRNPYSFNVEGNNLEILNRKGFLLKNIGISDWDNQRYGSGYNSKDLVTIFDKDGDGRNEVLLNLATTESLEASLVLLSHNLEDTLWVNSLNFEVDYKKQPDSNIETQYLGRNVEVFDVDGDGVKEIFITAEQAARFKAVLAKLDSKSGVLIESYKGAGWFGEFTLQDFDKDGKPEILVCTDYKSSGKDGCAVLDATNIEGFEPLEERYWDEEKVQAPTKLAFRWPQTIIGESLRTIRKVNSGRGVYSILTNEKNERMNLTYAELLNSGTQNLAPVNLLYTFDFRFNSLAISSSDEYDKVAKELLDDGTINIEANSLYLDKFRESIEWWNGEKWISKPTVNPIYLQSVGEDSSYYKEWYFGGNE